jgi:hypothetical protein
VPGPRLPPIRAIGVLDPARRSARSRDIG